MILRSNYLIHIYAVIFYFSLLVLARYENFSSLDNLLLLFTVFVFVFRYKPRVFLYPREFRFLLLLFLWSILGTFVVVSQEKFINFLQAFLNFTLSFFLTYHFQKFIKTKFIVSLFLIAIVFLYIDVKFINYELYILESESFSNIRLSGLLDDANRYARVMTYGIILMSIHSALNKNKIKLYKFLIYPALLLMFIDGVFLTSSRTSFSILLIIICLYILKLIFIKLNSLILKVLTTSILVIIIPGIYLYLFDYISDNYSMINRLETFDTGSEIRKNVFFSAFETFKKNIFFGTGLGNLSLNSSSSLNAHNDFMEILATTGLIGFIIYLKFNFVFIKKIIFSKFRNDRTFIDKNIIITIIIIYFIYSFSTWHFLSLYSGVLLGIISFLADDSKT
jgi:hypothetical protein